MKKQLVITTIITILFTVNIFLTNKMLQKSNENEQILNQLARNKAEFNTFVRKNGLKMDVSFEVIKKKDLQIENMQNEIHRLKKQIQNATKKNESPTSQISRGNNKNYTSFYVEGTAYTSDCLGCSGLTFSEYNVRNTIYFGEYRIVATDLNVIPLYSLLKVQTNNESFYAIVLDKGGAIKGYRMDLLVNSYQDAISFGRQKVKVTILRKGKG
jgi:3D (Asp-Asp-Asp) domain-containing protein